jgi:cyclopropane-fatty-acyl-phospholipid synthase
MSIDKETIEVLLSGTGIVIDGQEPCDIRIKNPKFYRRVLRDGSIGLGESYMEGWWECYALDEFFCKLFSKQIEKGFSGSFLKKKKNYSFQK